MIGRTHGIHGEPITLGLKFAHFYAEMLRNKERLIEAKRQIAVGKLSGAVGTFSNLNPDLEEEVCERLGLIPEKIATQVISRDRHAFFISVLGIIAGTLERMAQEIRLLQKTEGREIEEPFAEGQKGSSAMPHKRNPVISERICGLARVIQSNVMTALRNMPLWHERDISHSSAERVILPDSTIALDYILDKMCYILNNLHVYPENIQRVLNATRGLIFSQKVLLALVQKGLEREESYKIVQGLAMEVWNDPNLHFKEEILRRDIFRKYLTEKEVEEIFDLKAFLKNVDAIYKRLELL
jgi:adenylosuccinate lyase